MCVRAVCDLLVEPVGPLPGGGLAVHPHAVLRAAGQGEQSYGWLVKHAPLNCGVFKCHEYLAATWA